MAEGNVKCDLCRWKQPVSFDDIPNWHNKKCPKCNKGIIVNDEDLRVWNNADLLLKMQDIIDPNKEMARKDVLINTSPMRDGKPLDIK